MSSAVIDVYLADWCGQCNDFKNKTWTALSKRIKAKEFVGVTCNDHIVGTTKGNEAISNAGIEGFPTITVTRGGKTFEPKSRSEKDILAAATGKSNVNQAGGSDSYYKNKYIKYKTKYISLKNKI